MLNNKALVLSRHNTDIDYVGKALCSLISDTTLNNPETLRNAPPKFSRAEFQLYVFRVLTSLASYHAYLKPDTQQKLVKCLEVGLKFKGLYLLLEIFVSTISIFIIEFENQLMVFEF